MALVLGFWFGIALLGLGNLNDGLPKPLPAFIRCGATRLLLQRLVQLAQGNGTLAAQGGLGQL